MYITLSPSPSVILLCSLSSFGLRLLQSVTFAAWGIAQSCPFTADLQKKICHCLSQTRTGNSISHEIENVTTDIRCQCWEGKAWAAERGSKAFPSFIPAAGGNSPGCHAQEVVRQEGVCAPSATLCARAWAAVGTLCKCWSVLLMLWLQGWLSGKAGSRDPKAAGLGCLGAVPDTAGVPPAQEGEQLRSAMLGLHWSVQLALYSSSGLKKTPALQRGRARLHSVLLLCAARYCESSEAPEVLARGPSTAQAHPAAQEGLCHHRVLFTQYSYCASHRIHYSTWSQKKHGLMNTLLMLGPSFKIGKQISSSLLVDNAIMNVYKGVFNGLLFLKAKYLRHLLFWGVKYVLQGN